MSRAYPQGSGLRWVLALLLGRVELVLAGLGAEALEVGELVRLVDAHALEEHDAGRGVDLRVAREPDAVFEPRLLEEEGRARLDRGEQPAAHLERLDQTRFEPHHLPLRGVNPDDAAQLRDERLAAVRGLEAGARPEVEDDHVAVAKALAARADELARAEEGRNLHVVFVLITFIIFRAGLRGLRAPLLALFGTLPLALLRALGRLALGLLHL